MLKKIFKVLKKIVISAFALYGFNLLIAPLSIVVPINLITVGTMTVLGLPAVFLFIVINLLVF